MTQKTATSGSKELNQILTSLNQEGEFAISVLTDEQGLPIASASQDDGHHRRLPVSVHAIL